MMYLVIPNQAHHHIFIRYRILHASIFTAFMKLFEQIPVFGNTINITHIVQSQYNLTVKNTSLYFDVCYNTAGGCGSSRPTVQPLRNQSILECRLDLIMKIKLSSLL